MRALRDTQTHLRPIGARRTPHRRSTSSTTEPVNLFDRPSTRQVVGVLLLTFVLTVVGGQIGLASTLVFEPQWMARAQVQYRGTAWTETQEVAVQSRSLVAPVAANHGIDVKDFEEKLDAGLVPGTQIVQIDFVNSDPALAQSAVAELADGYLDRISERTPETIRDTLQEELDTVQVDLAQAELELEISSRDDTPAGRADQAANQAVVNSLRARQNDLETRLLENQIQALDESVNGLPVLITEPFVFEEQVFPRPRVFSAAGAVFGMLAGLGFLGAQWNAMVRRRNQSAGLRAGHS